MALHSISRQDDGPALSEVEGFTLIEVVISIAVLAVILVLGLFVSFDFYKSYAFNSEKNIIVSVLQKARNQSLDNINQTRHGVHFSNPLEYIIFECKSGNPQCTDYATGADTSKNFPPVVHMYGVSIPNTPFDVIFDQLSGDCVSSNCPLPINVNANGKTQTVSVNSEGQIDW